jgi:hypothetical protein
MDLETEESLLKGPKFEKEESLKDELNFPAKLEKERHRQLRVDFW